MKSLQKLIAVGMLATIMHACTQEEKLMPEKVQFTFAFKSPDGTPGRVGSFELPPGTSLMISIEKENGQPVLANYKIGLLSVGGSYITEPLALAPGHYKLTDFMLVNEDSEVLYATPRKGSMLAEVVDNPLPHKFTVIRNKVTELEMEVIDVTRSEPEAFGYASFDVDIVNALQVAVFVAEDDDVSLTTAKAYLLKTRDLVFYDTLQRFDLAAKVNLLPYKQDANELLTFVVVKDTYITYRREFTLTELLAELNNQPLSIVLQPTLTVVGYSSDTADYLLNFEIEFNTTADFDVDWGDGFTEHVHVTDYSWNPHHGYNSPPGKHTITISGDLSKIVSFTAYSTDYIDLTHLPELRTFQIPYTMGPRTLDLSKNKKLHWLFLVDTNIETFDIAANTKLQYFYLVKCPNITTERIDILINSLYTNVTTTNLQNGSAHLSKGFYGEGQFFTGPPSEASLAKLRIIRDSYYWGITPSDF